MRINNTSIDFRRPDLTKAGQGGAAEGGSRPSAPQPATPAGRSDKVQISDAGRALAAQQPEGAEGARAELSAERVSEIRGRILQGAYNSLEVVDEVARRMLQRGDI